MTSSAVSSRTVAAATGVRSNRGIGAIGEGGAAGEWENGIVTDHRVLAARQCQRVVETERGKVALTARVADLGVLFALILDHCLEASHIAAPEALQDRMCHPPP